MKHEDNWKQFTMTGRVDDYLRYRLEDIADLDKAMMRADNDMAAIESSMGDYYGRDIYGDGDGSIGTTRR